MSARAWRFRKVSEFGFRDHPPVYVRRTPDGLVVVRKGGAAERRVASQMRTINRRKARRSCANTEDATRDPDTDINGRTNHSWLAARVGDFADAFAESLISTNERHDDERLREVLGSSFC